MPIKAIAHVVDLEIFKQGFVCWAYNAVAIKPMQASNFEYITIAI